MSCFPASTTPRRRARWLAPAFLLAALTLTPTATAAPAPTPAQELRDASPYVAGEAIVRYEAGISAAERRQARRRIGATRISGLELPRAELVAIEGNVKAAVKQLESQPEIADAQPNYRYEALAAAPDDSFFSQLWGLGAAPAFGVDALPAWDISTGEGITIAIVDTGVDLTHPDLAPQLWTNPDESAGPGDGDGNGFAGDVYGYDFVDDDGDPDDYNFHGTHVAGTAAARAGNGIGIAGVAPGAKIMAVRALDGNGSGSTATIATSIVYAASEGARVINLSLGGPPGAQDHFVEEAVQIAADYGGVVVAAAGNDGADNDATPTTPCNIPAANLICVAAVTKTGALAPFSNYGATSVDLGAPGTEILSAKTDYGAPIFSENFGSGLGAWETEVDNGGVPWGAISNGGSQMATDSPAGNYGGPVDPSEEATSILVTAAPVSLAGERGCRIHFATRYQIQDLSPNGAFRDLFAVGAFDAEGDFVGEFFAGTSPGFAQGKMVGGEASIAEFGADEEVWPAFAIVADELLEFDGAYVDNVRMICRDDTYTNAIASLANYDLPDSGNYVEFQGTSMATPHVAGVAALVLAAEPGLSGAEAVAAIKAGARPIGSLAGKTASGGLLDALGALEALTHDSGSEGGVIAPPSTTAGTTESPNPFEGGPSASRSAAVRKPPATFFRRRPARVVRTGKRTARLVFRFGVDQRGVSFRCRVDRGRWRPCGARLARRFGPGRHVLRVQARNADGLLDPTPAVHRFRIKRIR